MYTPSMTSKTLKYNHKPGVKHVMFKDYASQSLEKIHDNCRRNEQPDVYETSYKPLLLEKVYNYGHDTKTRRNMTMRSLSSKDRSKTTTFNVSTPKQANNIMNRSFTSKSVKSNKQRCSSGFNAGSIQEISIRYNERKIVTPTQCTTLPYSESRDDIKIDNLVFFLKKLYFAKTKDLAINANDKQQKIFIARLKRSINQHQFVTPQCDFGLNSIQSICKYLKTQSISKLNLDKNPIGDEGALKIAEILPQLNLRQLSLVSINITTKSSPTLIRSLIGMPNLQILNISSPQGLNRNRINPQGYLQIKEVLMSPLCKLTVLNLSNTGMNSLGFVHFMNSFNKKLNLQLKLLNLSNNEISIAEEDQQNIRQSLANIKVDRLELQNNLLGDIGGRILAQVVGAQYGRSCISNHLTYLDISANGIKNYGFESICNSFSGNKKLAELILNSNNLSQHQIFCHVQHLLSHTWSIKKLSLRQTLHNTKSSAFQVKKLAEGLFKNKSLRQLDISYNFIGEEGFYQIFDNIQDNKTLKILKMQGCSIDDNFLQKAQNLMKSNKSLVSLNLCNNFINDRGGTILLKIISQANNLSDLNIKRNCLNLHMLNDLSYQLKQNKLAMESRQDPQYNYINYIVGLQQEQKNSILTAIKQLSTKTGKIKARDLALDVVYQQDSIMKKQGEIKTETAKISKLETDISTALKQKEKKRWKQKYEPVVQQTFLVTN